MSREDLPMSVTILGSGTCVPSIRRSACSALISAGDRKLLMDIGPGTTRRLTEIGTSIFDISHVFLSHFHPDHSGELASFLFSNKYPDGSHRKQPLTIAGGKGLVAFIQKLTAVFGRWIELPPGLVDLVEFDTIAKDFRRFEQFSVFTCPVAHNPESVAYRIEDANGSSAVYSGDTDECDGLADLSRNADLLICESALPDNAKVSGHLTPSLAGRIASNAGVKQLVLTHFYPECDTADIRGQCRKTWNGPLLLAEDLMHIAVG